MGALSTADALSAIVNHLWQSTLFTAAVALLAVGFRRQTAQVRYAVWLAASMKFLMPFTALVALGGAVSWRTADVVPFAAPAVLLDAISEPFSPAPVAAATPAGDAAGAFLPAFLPLALFVVWAIGALTVSAVWVVRWRRVHASVRRAVALEHGREVAIMRALAARHRVRPIPIVVSDSPLEPGVFGIVRPVLLWPRGIGDRLSDEQMSAVLAHELCHLRRRDNLAAALHTIVQALCWFHPLVWWIGARLVAERERACDEEVLRLGSEPEVYAESILKTCAFYVESPLACVAGITGSDLKDRIERIMGGRPAVPLGPVRRLILAGAAMLAIAIPVTAGVLHGRPVAAQSADAGQAALRFEVVSIKPNDGSMMRVMQRHLPGGGFEGFNVTVGAMIRLAYRLQDFQMAGEPEWVHLERFDIQARGPEGAGPNDTLPRIQSLLAERFNLQTHRETRDLPIYALTLARSDGTLGPRLTPSPVDCQVLAERRARDNAFAPAVPPGAGDAAACGNVIRGPGRLIARGQRMADFSSMLAQFAGRMVVDRTGLAEAFDLELEFAAPPPRPGIGLGGGLPGAALFDVAADSSRVSIFTALEEQLGLELVAQTGPVEVLVIDHVERPTPD